MKVSAVIPAFNAERELSQAVNSVLAQTVPDLELIIVDDGSTDGTQTVARSFSDPRVRVGVQENSGAAAARNKGIEMARGDYVAFLDADDLWLPHKLDRQLAVLETSDAQAAQSGAYWVDDQLQLLSVRPCSASPDPLLDTLRFRNMPSSMSTLIVERAKLEEVGGFDTSLVILEEWDMMIKAARYCGLLSIEEPLALYRVYSGNRSRDLHIHIEPGFRILERLFADPDLPQRVRDHQREIYGRFYTMLAGGAFKVGSWSDCARWAWRALRTDPRMIAYMAGMPYRHLRRRRSTTGSDLPRIENQSAAEAR